MDILVFDDAKDSLQSRGFAHIEDFAPEGPEYSTDFLAFWERLPLDENFKSYTTRERRILKYRYTHPGHFEIDRDPVYKPRAQYSIDYVKGENRLGYAEDDFIAHPLTGELIKRDLEAIDFYLEPGKTYRLDINLFRVKAEAGAISPTTSGIHQDGQDWIFMHFVNASNVQPVGSIIYENSTAESKVFQKPLSGFLETLIVNDRTMYHSAGHVAQINPTICGYRDIIVAGLSQL
jgi:hypothetical protein